MWPEHQLSCAVSCSACAPGVTTRGACLSSGPPRGSESGSFYQIPLCEATCQRLYAEPQHVGAAVRPRGQ